MLRIDRVQTFGLKIPHHDNFGGLASHPEAFVGGEYYFEKHWNEVYSTSTRALLVRVEASDGTYGWGEPQAPIAPEVAQQVIDRLLGPMLIGCDPTQVNQHWERMYKSMNVRGQTSGFMLDAIAGLDAALWDIAGKVSGAPVSAMLGGAVRTTLPAYVSGLRGRSWDEQVEYALKHLQQGYAAIKLYLGEGLQNDIAHAQAIRSGIGTDRRLLTDWLWGYSLVEGTRLGREMEDLGVEWVETPLAVEDREGHARLADALTVAVAAGECMRTRYQFLDWFNAAALDVAQPDVARCGITEAKRIADLALSFHRPVAFHLGLSMGVSMAATWHVASSLPNFYIQEAHPPMIALSNEFLLKPLQVERGELVVPTGPGLGIDVDIKALEPWISSRGEVSR